MTESVSASPIPKTAELSPKQSKHQMGLRIQFGRYAWAGIVVTIVDYIGFILSIQLGLSVPQSITASKAIATTTGAVLHRQFTFAGPQRLNPTRQLLAYGLLSVFNLGLALFLISLLTILTNLPPIAAKLATDSVIIILSFVISRRVIYAHTQP